ncbi:MAG: SpvB/TcaC N-terminal domain-containing protein, partial [Anaerolineales bacterium]
MSVPIAASPSRSGFGPQLSLSYDSGAGNGPYGYGWNLSLPSITRKTDKGLPRYQDAQESDVFILSGAEDLVPVLMQQGGQWVPETTPDRTIASGTYRIKRYRPRVEGLFARIERWSNTGDPSDVHWRSLSKENILTIYGKDSNSRIFDPEDANRIFGWFICETRDDKGNAVLYKYAEENEDNIDRSLVNERNRIRTARRYLKRILYGNRTPLLDGNGRRPAFIPQQELDNMDWLFEVVFDYGDGHYEELDLDPSLPEDEQHRFVLASSEVGAKWPVRPDSFSSYRAGFEARTHRRCQRVLVFHHIPDLPTGENGYEGLVRSTEFDYADLDYGQVVSIEDELTHQGSTRFASFIRSITQSGFRRDETQALVIRENVEYATYLKKSMPPLEFEYSKATIQEEILTLEDDSLANLPVGLDGAIYRWVDLDGEGLSGILTEQADAWFYKPNLGEGRLGPLRHVGHKPSLASVSDGGQQFLDLAGDGQLDLVELDRPTPGFYERDDSQNWVNFKPFLSLPNVDWDDPNLRFVDLTGDGHADVLITEGEAFTWYISQAEDGFGAAERLHNLLDEEKGPRLVFAVGDQSIYLADLSGDGLTDLARIRNGEVCYWPSLGYGRFGEKVTMDGSPHFDVAGQFDTKDVRLADIDGSGTTDLIYLGKECVQIYFNQSGNSWSKPYFLEQFPAIDNLSSVMTVDLLGNGTSCLVWSSPLPSVSGAPLHYLDLMGGKKPNLLVKIYNNMGAETRIGYAASTKFYLEDKAAGKPWITKIPFPVHVIESVEVFDHLSRNRFVTRYAYHHGYFDGEDREFRGFGMVEQWDTEEYATLAESDAFPAGDNIDESSHVPPVLTKTWFHTGVYLGRHRISNYFAGLLDAHDSGEYYREPGLTDAAANDLLLEDTILPDGLLVIEEKDACRALKGSMLRQEVYAMDGTSEAAHPYTVSEQNLSVRCLQPE